MVQTLRHNLAGDATDPNSFPHRRVVGCQGHASNKKTVLVRYLHTCHIHKLVWRTGLYVERLPQRIDGNAQTEKEILHPFLDCGLVLQIRGCKPQHCLTSVVRLHRTIVFELFLYEAELLLVWMNAFFVLDSAFRLSMV